MWILFRKFSKQKFWNGSMAKLLHKKVVSLSQNNINNLILNMSPQGGELHLNMSSNLACGSHLVTWKLHRMEKIGRSYHELAKARMDTLLWLYVCDQGLQTFKGHRSNCDHVMLIYRSMTRLSNPHCPNNMHLF